MRKKLNTLLKYVVKHNASDVHFLLEKGKLKIKVRGLQGFIAIQDKKLNDTLFHYLKFTANLDLGNSLLPQSGNFSYIYKNKELHFRFSYLRTLQSQSGVLRVLNNHPKIEIDQLSKEKKQNDIFHSWTNFRSGLILVSGPTGSGKSTTLHAVLEMIAEREQLNVISLEDPVEIKSDNYLQLQINERLNFDYREGIKQLLRHDPDVIMIGEIRDEETAKMLIRSALSGHMVFTTIHAKSCKEALLRLEEFGISKLDLKETVTGVTNQRIFKSKDSESRVCIYEILEKEDLKEVLENNKLPKGYADIKTKIKNAVSKGWIDKESAQSDIIT